MIAEARSLEERRAAYRGALLGVAAGNALGLRVEGSSRADIATSYPSGVTEVPETERDRPWDDDLAQTALLAEAIVERGTVDLDDVAARLVDWADANGRGMGVLTYEVIDELRAGTPAARAAETVWEESGRNAAGNGAAMRCAPIALRWHGDRDRLIAEARRSSLVTHFDPRREWSTAVTALAIAVSLDGDPVDPAAIMDPLAASAPEPVVAAARGAFDADLDDLELDDPRTMGYTLKAMQVALWATQQPADIEATLVDIVGAGGDTDTNAAPAGAVLGARYGDDAIPERWVANIAGIDRLIELADALLEASSDET